MSASASASASKMTSQTILAARANMTLNTKGADAFISTTNPILDLFTETRKKVPETLEEFTNLVRKIEAAKNFDSELFVKLLKFHRLIEKGNGLKGLYYISMMILKEENPDIYKQVLTWSRQYPKDILRLARLSSMFGCLTNSSSGSGSGSSSGSSSGSGSGSSVSIPLRLKYLSPKGDKKSTLGKKMTKWALTEIKTGNLSSSRTSSIATILISSEIELYSQLLVDVIKKILTGKMFDSDVNLMLFKYLSYETGHFAVESKIIWSRVKEILELDPVVQASKDAFIA